ncbi:polyphenol oxidase family protein [Pseudarthrobacter sp. J75]|uniref:polyphenol oxidase family protein n=1 Tax=unclassified Pseudarthrobacter TaxID=2647000 RepID=UPI002E81CBB9|nr:MULTISPECIES: polyphenol oxidase family protein [unclassified Pseudarthrobacter]MEE2522759.1 polyphenol oxidase family protein [Pseudarthrobacter sp. J47]MEE2529620.1 polyphenol oxidase family protein [Pseudarthrobacter sp. J75]
MFVWRGEALPGVSVAFTNSVAGNLALHVGDNPRDVGQRRVALESAVGIAPRRFQFMNQVHGTDVAVLDSPPVQAPTADALVSTVLPLAVMVADCIPVILVGEVQGGPAVLAAAHAGRPGLAAGVIPKTVSSMRQAGARNISAWLGPSICGRCYEVPAAMQAEVAHTVPGTASETSWGTPALDLPEGARRQLLAHNVDVRYSGPCTLETPGLFSYRRDKQTGRFAGLVWAHG